MRTAVAALGVAVVFALSACSAAGQDQGADPGAGCLDGGYLITEFSGLGANSQQASGRGGNIGITFRDGKYQLRSDGKQAMTLTTQGEEAELFVNGAASGSYAGSDGAVTLTALDSIGTARLRRGSEQQTLGMELVARVLVPEGEATATCRGDALTLQSRQTTLHLQRA